MNVSISPSVSRSERVVLLLVEDNPADVRLTREALREAKLRNPLHVVADGMEALDFLRREGRHPSAPRPDLVLLDLDLPGLGGLDLLAVIRRDRALENIPVVIVSASRNVADRAEAARLGVAGFVTKPVDFRQLISIIERLTGFYISIVAGDGVSAGRAPLAALWSDEWEICLPRFAE